MAGVAIEARSNRTRFLLELGKLDQGDWQRIDKAGNRRLRYHSASAIGDGLLNELSAIMRITGKRQKDVTGLHSTTVYGYARHINIQDLTRLDQVMQRDRMAHAFPPGCLSRLAIPSAGTVGGTFNRRNAPSATREHTGAAAAPPP